VPTSAWQLSDGTYLSERGIPQQGSTLLGAAYGGNSDPTAWEGDLGRQLGVRRTFWQSTNVDSAVRTAKADVAANRVPWLSFKLPHSWPDMVAGKGDAWAKDIALKLKAVDGPVWVAFHHEPENDGDITQSTTPPTSPTRSSSPAGTSVPAARRSSA
jgi:hypothetical protein